MNVQVYRDDELALRAYIRRFAKGGLVASRGIDPVTRRRVGGRPPVAAEAFRLLLRNAQVLAPAPRAPARTLRARRADEAARVGFGRLFRTVGPTKILPYPRIERTVTAATGADRDSRRWAATVHFCEARILAPYQVAGDPPRPYLFPAPLPNLVPELWYGWGPVTYQSTLDEAPPSQG